MTCSGSRKCPQSFGSLEVMKGVDLTVDAGEFCVFVGPSGCGKSTLLRIISGLETSDLGQGIHRRARTLPMPNLPSAVSPWSSNPMRSTRI